MTPFLLVVLIFLVVLGGVCAVCMIPLDLFLTAGRHGGVNTFEGFVAFGILGLGFSQAEKKAMPVFREGRLIFMSGMPKQAEQPVSGPSGEPAPAVDYRKVLQAARAGLSLLPSLLQLVSRIGRHIRIRRITGELEIGFPNPADTGILFGYYCAVSPILLITDRIGFRLTPVFDRETLEGEVDLELRMMYPLSVIAGGARFFADPKNRAAIRIITSAGSR